MSVLSTHEVKTKVWCDEKNAFNNIFQFKSSLTRVLEKSFSFVWQNAGKLSFCCQNKTFSLKSWKHCRRLNWRFHLLPFLPFVIPFVVSFSGQQNGTATGAFVSSRSEPISLSTLDRDCFIIPIRSLERFLPAGVPVSFPPTFHHRGLCQCSFFILASSSCPWNKRSNLQSKHIVCAWSIGP